jgi:O-succinylhomoserine sulfhydrylase
VPAYSRFTNPTVRAFEKRLAAMEGGERAIGMASGMAAILGVCMGLLRAGDHVICSHGVFGTTTSLFANQLSRFGITTTFVSPTDVGAWQAAIESNTQLLFLETPSNPLTEISDIRALADLAHNNNARLVGSGLIWSRIRRPNTSMAKAAVLVVRLWVMRKRSTSKFFRFSGPRVRA